MKRLLLPATLALAACSGLPSSEASIDARARELARETLILDGHIDVPIRLMQRMEDISGPTERGDFDHPRAVAGGLDAPFMSIYVPARMEEEGGAKDFADRLIDTVEAIAAASPDKFVVAHSVADVREAFARGLVALPLGMENGSPLEGDLANLDHFHARGIRYITLCHSRDNHICDSSYDDRHTAGGLTPFGERVVRRMNELGIMIDVSHVSDDAFWDVMELTQVPVIASHSSLRHFTPGFERNMSDDMVRAMAENGGVVQINFGSTFVSDESRLHGERQREKARAWAAEQGLEPGDPKVREYRRQLRASEPMPFADVTDVADHIDRVVELVGVEHVGFGSDFDGVGDTLPTRLKDVSEFPNLIAELLRRGYSEEEIGWIASGNVLRVWETVEEHARTR